ncbi:MAG: metallophosphoesterase [Ktedonobacteraceae bacterium]|nr:metallophosphoesterase [Ktedonobacteraceae bacterium]
MSKSTPHYEGAVLYFWAIGDLHYRTLPAWDATHRRRLAHMFTDLHELWQEIGAPAFCVSPGDLVETCAPANHQLARARLQEELGTIPFYPGLGNHEFFGPDGDDPATMARTFTEIWGKPLRYTWQAGPITCIMLDYPDPQTLAEVEHVYISEEALRFLDTALSEHADQRALIFLHCPLRNTVLERGPGRDFHSLERFFSPENSQEVRGILARHRNASLFFSGHTHSGWESPGLVTTEQLNNHAVTFVNLMSPWYTGRKAGPYSGSYVADDPDIIPSFCVQIYNDFASIRVREHFTRRWLKEWKVPLDEATR